MPIVQIKQLLRFFLVHTVYLYQFYWFRRKYGQNLINELEAILPVNQQHLIQEQQKRIKLYMYVGSYVNDCLATLRGRNMSRKEIKLTLYLSALTPLLDDLTDNYNLSSVQILEHLHQEEAARPLHFLLAGYLYDRIRAENEQDLFHGIFREALLFQDESLQQLDQKILGMETLSKITCDKGSRSTFLFRLMLDHPLREGEKEAVEAFGALIQFTNDMFDVYKDVQNGQQTCYTNAVDMVLMQQDYNSRLKDVMQRFSSLPYEQKYIRKASDKLLIIGVLGKQCLEHLKSSQDMSGGIFKSNTYSRKQLVCDMAKWSNRLSYMKTTLQLYRKD